MAINLKKSKSSKDKGKLETEMQKIQDQMKAIDEEEARVQAEEDAIIKAEAKTKSDLEAKVKKLDLEMDSLKAQDSLLMNDPGEEDEVGLDEVEDLDEQEIDLNKETVSKEENMVEKDSKEVMKSLKAQEKALKKEEKRLTAQAKKKDKESLKKIKEDASEERRQAKIKKIEVTVGGKSYMFPEKSIYDLSKKDFKIKEDRRKIKEGEVCILYLRESGIAEIKYVKPENGMFIVEGMYYHIVEACNYSLGPKRIPLAVIPEWSFIPISRKTHWDKLGGIPASAQKLIIKSLESAEIVKIRQENEPAKKADGKLVIGILVAAVIGLYLFSKTTGAA